VPPFSVTSLFSEARLDSWLGVALVLAGGFYLYGVHRLRARGDRWPVSRSLTFVGLGLGTIAVLTLSGLGAYDTTLLSVHMVQHMGLSMLAPIFLALGAPVTLALRTLGKRPRRILATALHSRPARVLANPLFSFGIFVLNPFALYFSGLYELSLRDPFVHELVHAHFIATGCLFFWPLLGRDPLPGRWPHPARALLMILSVPFHTVLGLSIMQSTRLLGGDWYPSLGLSWIDPKADQVTAGGVLWAGGELVSVVMLGILVAQWVKHARLEAARIDRELDREEERLRRPVTRQLAGAPPDDSI
jgi:putative membrane protein